MDYHHIQRLYRKLTAGTITRKELKTLLEHTKNNKDFRDGMQHLIEEQWEKRFAGRVDDTEVHGALPDDADEAAVLDILAAATGSEPQKDQPMQRIYRIYRSNRVWLKVAAVLLLVTVAGALAYQWGSARLRANRTTSI